MRDRSHAPPWLFGVLILPFGLVSGYCSVALPFILAARHYDVATITGATALAAWPHAWKIFWVPALDARWRRRSWYLGSVLVTAVSLAVALVLLPSQHLGWVTAALFVSNTAVATSSAAIDALMATTLPDDRKGAAAGWSMAGNLGGSGLGGYLAIELYQRTSSVIGAVILGGLALATGIPAWMVREGPGPTDPVGRALVRLARELWVTARSTAGWTGIVICIGPAGAGAAAGVFSAFAQDFHAGARVVENVNGLGGGVMSALGSVLGGYAADRMNRRLAYALAGALTGLVAVWMAYASRVPLSFSIGCLAYNLANGVAFAAWAALVLEMIGEGPGAATKYALFTAAANQAITYMQVLDGLGYDGRGIFHALGGHARGLLLTDALGTAVGLGILAVMVVVVRRYKLGETAPSGVAPSGAWSPGDGA